MLGSRAHNKPGHRVKYKINGKRVLRSRYEMERKLGRPLLSTEVVHHIDENPNNDSWDNLELKSSQAQHAREHRLGKRIKRPEFTVCKHCRRKFKTPKHGRVKKFCNRECYQAWRR